MDGLYLCEAAELGGRLVAGPFASGEEAGEWRSANPPLTDNGPYLHRYLDGERVGLAADDMAGYITSGWSLGAVA